MKKLIALILFPFLVIPFGAKANDNFSVENRGTYTSNGAI